MQFLLKVLQLATVVAVVGSNVAYQWTPNGFVAGLVGLFAALLVTAIITESLRLCRWLRSLKRFNKSEILRDGINREPTAHQLIGERPLDGLGHDHAPR